MTDEEHLENTVPTAGDDGASFDVYLPVNSRQDAEGATHVAHMRGNQMEFADVLAAFVATGSALSQPLRVPVESSNLGDIEFSLQGLGPARVESIDPL